MLCVQELALTAEPAPPMKTFSIYVLGVGDTIRLAGILGKWHCSLPTKRCQELGSMCAP